MNKQPVGKVIQKKPKAASYISSGAIATLDTSTGKTIKSLHPPAFNGTDSLPSPTSSLQIRSPPKPSIIQRTSFRITGKVQGVYFRKYTQQKAVELSIFGVVENHPDGSVIGEAEGRMEKMVEFKHWLETKGSPKSKIESASFTDTTVESRKYSKFDIVR